MNKPIRVLQVFSGMNRGGAETMLMNIYRHIDRSKVQFDFVVHTNDKCDYDDEIESLGGKIYHIPRFTAKTALHYSRIWRDFFDSHREYKIVHSHIRSTASIIVKQAKKYNLSTIVHSHNTSSGKGVSAIIKNILQIPIRWQSDFLFACSDDAGKWLFGKNSLKNDNYYLVKNSIDAGSYRFDSTKRMAIRNEIGVEGKWVLGHVGRFINQKNHEFLIDIFCDFHKIEPNSVLLLIGRGELEEKIKNKVSDLNLDDAVIFMGVRSDITDLMLAMDVFVFPSLFEGLGIVAIEAQASGLKTIVSDTIPKEAKVTELIEFVSLEKSAEQWANIIVNNLKYNRVDKTSELKASGYDIKQDIQWLQDFYLKAGENNGIFL